MSGKDFRVEIGCEDAVQSTNIMWTSQCSFNLAETFYEAL